ncbi:MAG: PilN domain-containing protein [Candidatus Aminicenantales bacterium]
MIRINLLKPESKEFREGPVVSGPEFRPKKAFPFTSVFVLLLIGVLAAGFFLQKRMINQEQERLQAAQAEKKKLEYVIAKLDELEKQKAVFVRKIGLIRQLRAQQDSAVTIMDELSKKLPDWVWLTELSSQGQMIQIKGNALSNNLIADYISNLESSPHLTNVNLISSTQKSGRSAQFLEFSLTLNYVLPEAAQSPPQEAAAKPKAKAKKR